MQIKGAVFLTIIQNVTAGNARNSIRMTEKVDDISQTGSINQKLRHIYLLPIFCMSFCSNVISEIKHGKLHVEPVKLLHLSLYGGETYTKHKPSYHC